MAFDPFNDFETRGYLQNHAATKDADIVRRLEHNAFSGNILKALSDLQETTEIDLSQVRQVHQTLFSDVYPWAGQDRSQNASDLNITKGTIDFQLAPYVPRGIEHALDNASNPSSFRDDPGKIIGELAYAHPFLEGNGRTITAIVSELSRRADFHVAWQETSKQEYLTALTKELNEPDKKHLTNYLKPFIREGALGIEDTARQLSTLPGLSAPDSNLARVQETQPVLSIFAGPNGAGKSTLTASGLFGDAKIIDPDAIARELSPENPSAVASRAGKRALDLRKELLSKKQSFVIETTLSGNSTLSLIDEAKANGYRVELRYIGLNDVDLAKVRVAGRVSSGGHDVPDEDITRRFGRSLENLPEAISRSDRSDIYDNSGIKPLRRVAEIAKDYSLFLDAATWATDAAFASAQDDLSAATTVKELERSTQRAFDAARAGGVTDDQLQREVQQVHRTRTRRQAREGHDL